MTVEHIFECVSVKLSIKNYSNVIINCVYRTPGSNLETFCEKIEVFYGAPNRPKQYLYGVISI